MRPARRSWNQRPDAAANSGGALRLNSQTRSARVFDARNSRSVRSASLMKRSMRQRPSVAHSGGSSSNSAQLRRISAHANSLRSGSTASRTSTTRMSSAARASANPPAMPSIPTTSPASFMRVNTLARYRSGICWNRARSTTLTGASVLASMEQGVQRVFRAGAVEIGSQNYHLTGASIRDATGSVNPGPICAVPPDYATPPATGMSVADRHRWKYVQPCQWHGCTYVWWCSSAAHYPAPGVAFADVPVAPGAAPAERREPQSNVNDWTVSSRVPFTESQSAETAWVVRSNSFSPLMRM